MHVFARDLEVVLFTTPAPIEGEGEVDFVNNKLPRE